MEIFICGKCSLQWHYIINSFLYYSGPNVKDVPYSRLIDASPVTQTLPQKLDSDSKLNVERSKSILNVPEIETAPKSSVSDSKLAVDYFTATENIETLESANSPQSLPVVPTEFNISASICLTGKDEQRERMNVSDSHHSLYARTNSEERLKQEVKDIILNSVRYYLPCLCVCLKGTTYDIHVVGKSLGSILFGR